MYSDEQIREVKERVELIDVMSQYTALKKAGANFVGCCPFHQERTPSMQVYVDQGTFHCFGCKEHGDVIHLVQKKENLDFQGAVELLANRAGIDLKPVAGDKGRTKSERSALADAFEMAVRFYEHCLWESAGGAVALDYLRSERGYTDQTIKRFRLGWAPGRGALMTHAHGRGTDQRLLRELDLLVVRDDQLRDRFFDRITFPICDRFGTPIAISARVLPDAERAAKEAGRPVGKYVNTAETPLFKKGSVVFNLHRARLAVKDRHRLLVFEAQTGCMAADQAGLPESIACLGTAFTSDHAKQLANLAGGEPIVIVFDGDDAGRVASLKAIDTCLAAGVSVKIARPPADADPDELLAQGADKELGKTVIEQCIAEALPDLDFLLFATAADPRALNDIERVYKADAAIAAIGPMPDHLLRDLYLKQIAKYFRLEKSALKKRANWSDGTANGHPLRSRAAATRGSGFSAGEFGEDDEGGEPVRGLHDQGNAERFITRHGENLRYCFEFGKNGWFIWTGSHWKQDLTQEVNRLVVETLTMVLPKEAEAYRLRGSDHAADQTEVWMRTSLNQRKIEAVLTVAQKEPRVGVLSSDFNRDPWLFACDNGTVDLKTGTLKPAARTDLITRCSPLKFNPSATCERWTKFLDELAQGDQELIAYLQRAAGYSMTGSTREETMFIVTGPGGSGKSTFMSALETTLGDYADTIDFEMFLASNVGKRETYYAAIQQARLVQCEESGDGKRFAEDVVKKVTGGNPLQARHLYGSAYSYVPKFKVWMVSNELPRVSDTDSGFWRRVHVIACTNAIPAERRDVDFKDYLRSDPTAGEALLAWCVLGAKAYAENRLQPPESVIAEGLNYRAENDPLQEFLDEYTVWGSDEKVTKQDLRESYDRWCQGENSRPLSAKAFAKRLEARGAERGKTRIDPKANGPVGCWRGLRLRNEFDAFERPSNAPRADLMAGTKSRRASGHAPTASRPTDPQTTIAYKSESYTGAASAVPVTANGTEKDNEKADFSEAGREGRESSVRTREGNQEFISPPLEKENTGKYDPAVPRPDDEKKSDVPRGTKLARPPNASEDLLADDDPAADQPDDQPDDLTPF